MIVNSTLDLISRTPLLCLDKLDTGAGKIYGKLEYLQPGGSLKDRAALQVISDAYHSGRLKKGQLVVEMTSGNMGSGLALVCKQLGNPFLAVMPVGNSQERLRLLKAFGAEIILSRQEDGKPGMVTGKDIAMAAEMAKTIAKERGGYYVDQFNNYSGLKVHFETTGPEIWEDLSSIDVFISSVGTGASFIGTSKYLKSRNSNIKCIAVEPEFSAILKTGRVRDPRHIIQGTGYGFVPPHWSPEVADEIILVSDAEVKQMTQEIALKQGLYVGYSSGANVKAALKYLEKMKSDEKIVVLLCDSGFKYGDL
ncbi:MAG: cysteine synthase family protein [Bacteroidota bacterium]